MEIVNSKDGIQIAYEISGNGPLVIFISGAICHRRFMPILDDVKVFSKKLKIINYDRRGRGDSGDKLPYSPENELDDLEALIDSSGGKANLYGHSSGAVIALEAAIRFPEKINKILLYDLPYVHDETEKKSYAILEQEVRGHLAKKEHAKALRVFLTGIGMPKIFVYLLPLMPGWKKLKNLAPTLAYDLQLTHNTPDLQHLSKVSVPAKIVYGAKNGEGIKLNSVNIAGVIKNAELLEIPGQDHMIKPDILLPEMVKFFN